MPQNKKTRTKKKAKPHKSQAMTKNIKLSLKKFLKKPRSRLIVFVFVFGIIGILALLLTRAATINLATVEGETMTIAAGTSVISDTTASGSKALKYAANATSSGQFSLAQDSTSFTVRAKGSQCSGSPQMVVKVDGNQVQTSSVSSTSWTDYSTSLKLVSGSHSVEISFPNDYTAYRGKGGNIKCSRDLIVDKVTVNAYIPDPTSVTVTNPVNGTTVYGGIAVEAKANSTLAKVEFYLDGVLKTTESFAPYCMAGDGGSGTPCYNWESTTVPNGTHTITAYGYDSAGTKSGPSTVTFTVNNSSPTPTPISGTSPSGQPMPIGDLPGWQQIFTDDFTTDVALGNFPTAVSTKWNAYNNGWFDTFHNGMYCPKQVVSVSNGVLNKYLHHGVCSNTDGVNHRLAAVILPKIPPSNAVGAKSGQLYGRYVARFKTDALANFYAAWLLWPDSEEWPRDGEIDFPEGKLSGNIGGYVHKQGATAGSDQTGFSNIGVPFSPGWHTVVTEWSPNKVVLILDGNVVGTTTDRIPNTPMHWAIQTETGATSDTGANGNLQIDWVAVYKYAPL
jgi:hypothetical protein